MTLIRRKKVIAYTRYNQNFFEIDLIKLRKAMAIRYERPIHYVNKNK